MGAVYLCFVTLDLPSSPLGKLCASLKEVRGADVNDLLLGLSQVYMLIKYSARIRLNRPAPAVFNLLVKLWLKFVLAFALYKNSYIFLCLFCYTFLVTQGIALTRLLICRKDDGTSFTFIVHRRL